MGLLRGLISKSFCHTLNTWKASLLCGSSHNSLRGPISRSSCHILSIWKASPLCGSSHDPSRNLMLKALVCHTLCTWIEYLLSGSSHGFQVTWRKEALVTLCALEWLFSHVGSLMSHQVVLSHFVHLNGISPKWILSWVSNLKISSNLKLSTFCT